MTRAAPAGWMRAVDGGVLVAVRVTPKAGADRIAGLHVAADGALRLAVKVRAAPDRGAANVALCALLAVGFGVPGSAVAVVAGASARLKTVRIASEMASLEARGAAIVQASGGDPRSDL